MRVHLLAAVAILVAPLLAAACAEDSDMRQRQTPAYPTNTHDIAPGPQLGPQPQDMPGKGRGSEPLKGKP